MRDATNCPRNRSGRRHGCLGGWLAAVRAPGCPGPLAVQAPVERRTSQRGVDGPLGGGGAIQATRLLSEAACPPMMYLAYIIWAPEIGARGKDILCWVYQLDKLFKNQKTPKGHTFA